jgi:hypothetical protein
MQEVCFIQQAWIYTSVFYKILILRLYRFLHACFSSHESISPMWINLVWHGKCNSQKVKNPAYEKNHCIKPGGYIAVLFFVARLSSFLNSAATRPLRKSFGFTGSAGLNRRQPLKKYIDIFLAASTG